MPACAAFVDANYGLSGALRLHRQALGRDLLRAPANVALLGLSRRSGSGRPGLKRLGARGAARWLRRAATVLRADVARELTFRVHRDLLELPYDDGKRRAGRDALAEAILEDQQLTALLAAAGRSPQSRGARADPGDAPDLRGRAPRRGRSVQQRAAGRHWRRPVPEADARDLQPRPGARGRARAAGGGRSFPLGAGLGSLWYAWFPAEPSAGLVLGTTGGLMLLTALTAGFAGVISDPVQRALGLHDRRLHRLIDALGRELGGESEVAFQVRDHYVARIFDLVDLGRAAARALAG